MLRFFLLAGGLTLLALGCIESPPPASMVVGDLDAGVDVGNDQSSDGIESCTCEDDLYCNDEGGCVECLTNEQCGGEFCAPTGECVECLGADSSTCTGATPYCGQDNTCVACLVTGDCGGDLECEDSQCVGCQKDEDCGGLRCHTETATCVACLGDGKDSCPQDSPVCDFDSKSCVVCTDEDGCANGLKCKDEGQEGSRCVGCRNIGDCGDQQICNASEICVACDEVNLCTAGTCKINENPMLNTCVECLEDGDCDGELCLENVDVSKNICVSCRTNVDCPVASASVCSGANACVACQLATDCMHIAGSMQCDEGLCVGCTPATQALDCGGKVCDPTTMACTSVAVGTTLALRACAYNDQCQANHACVPLSYQGAAHGTYCMPLFSSGSACGRPYGFGGVARMDVNGQSVAVCMIAETLTTPEAIADQGTACTVATAAVDCPATGARCEVFNPMSIDSSRVCTYSCLGNNDCEPGADCIGVSGSKYCGAPQ